MNTGPSVISQDIGTHPNPSGHGDESDHGKRPHEAYGYGKQPHENYGYAGKPKGHEGEDHSKGLHG
ncbi:hypothetical protein ACFWJ5_05380 [Streptomyces qaidamensis]|uniref:hypothetical protein n=1 Tax=Streptomyces qaidamensis TaxID=1783515 RepID=UPI00364EA9FA